MAFKKLEARAGSVRLNVPAITIGKSMTTMNMAFCEKVGMENIGDCVGVSIFFDEDDDIFGIKVFEKDPTAGDKLAKYNKSRQAQIYLKTMLRQADYYPRKTMQIKVKWHKKHKMYLFKISEEHKGKPEAEEAKQVKVLNKKSKKREKNKRRKSEIARKF